MLRLLLHLMVDTLIQLAEAPILVITRMHEVLVARSQLTLQQLLQVIDDLGVAFHEHILEREG